MAASTATPSATGTTATAWATDQLSHPPSPPPPAHAPCVAHCPCPTPCGADGANCVWGVVGDASPLNRSPPTPPRQAMSAALAQKDGPAHDAALNLAVAQQRGEAPPPTGQVALQIHEASRAAWASHLQWERIRSSWGDHDAHELITSSHGLRCCPLCGSRQQHPLSVGFVLDNATCWCHGPCQRPWSGPCTAGCEGLCECEASLEAGHTVWYCDSCYTCCERDEGYIVCSRCMGFGDDPFGHTVRVTALDLVRDTARVARIAFGFE